MPFPDAPRVLYGNSPLVEVICQVRFPPILRIDTEIPAEYQDRVRKVFPLYQDTNEAPSIPADIIREMPSELRRLLPASEGKRVHDFKSINDRWSIRLTRDFLALTANAYTTWDDFAGYFRLAFDALLEVYAPSVSLRTGLRYQNAITRSKLKLDDVPWSELLSREIAGVLGDEQVGTKITGCGQVLEIILSDQIGKVTIRHGFTNVGGSQEISYLIDSDFYAVELEMGNDVIQRLNDFNRKAGRLLRWCITDRLHEAMGPKPIS